MPPARGEKWNMIPLGRPRTSVDIVGGFGVGRMMRAGAEYDWSLFSAGDYETGDRALEMNVIRSPSSTRQVNRPVAYAPVSMLIRLAQTSGSDTGV